MTERCGNAGAVERLESQQQAFHSFHEPLGNLANCRRDSHIPTAPTTKADGKVENQKQVSHFSHRRDSSLFKPKTQRRRSALRYHNPTKGDAPQHLNFRLIPHWNQISISGSFLDWKMLARIISQLSIHADTEP